MTWMSGTRMVFSNFRVVLMAMMFGLTGMAQAAGLERMTTATPGVTRVVMDAPGELTIRPGQDEKVIIEAEPKVLAKLEAVVRGDTLTLKTKGSFRTDKGIRYSVTIRGFRSLKTLSSGNASVSGFSGGDIDIQAGGSGNIDLANLKPRGLTLRIIDSGNISVSGEGTTLNASIDGAGTIDAVKFTARRVEASIDGSGDIRVRAEETLKASIEGAGNIEYAGKARVTKSINGAGNIDRI